MHIQRIIYWVATGLISALMLFSASIYFIKTEEIETVFSSLGHPTYIVIPLAILKICGVLAILSRAIPWITEWAYAGFFFNIILAAAAHNEVGETMTQALIALIVLLISYFFGKEVRPMYR